MGCTVQLTLLYVKLIVHHACSTYYLTVVPPKVQEIHKVTKKVQYTVLYVIPLIVLNQKDDPVIRNRKRSKWYPGSTFL